MPRIRSVYTPTDVVQGVNVKHHGAVGDGTADDTAAIQAAIDTAAVDGDTVYLPPGTYRIDPSGTGGSALQHASGNPIRIVGAGRLVSSLVCANASKDLLRLSVDGDEVADLTLDTRTHNAQAALVVVANDTALRRCRVLGGTAAFAVFYPGPVGASDTNLIYHTGNVIYGLELEDGYPGDGLSWSFQAGRNVIRDVRHVGSRLAIYLCKETLVDGYHYTPGSQAAGREGLWVTPPASRLRIRNFHGGGLDGASAGVIGRGTPEGSSTQYRANDVLIDGLCCRPGAGGTHAYLLADHVDGLRVTGASFEGNSGLYLGPAETTITASRVPQVAFSHVSPDTARLVTRDCDLPSFTPAPGQNGATFANFNGAPVTLDVAGGRFSGAGLLFGTGVTAAVRDVRGVNPAGVQGPPAMPASGTALANPYPYDCVVYITGGTVTAIAVGGVATGHTSGAFRLAAGQSITVTYSATPSWTWLAH